MSHAVAVDAAVLPFLVIEEEAEDRDAMGRLFRRGDAEVVVREIPVGALRENLKAAVATLRSLFDELADQSSSLPLREAQIGFEVSASGGIQLIGTSQVGAKGAITLVFRRD